MLRNSQYARARAAKWRDYHRLKWSTKAGASEDTGWFNHSLRVTSWSWPVTMTQLASCGTHDIGANVRAYNASEAVGCTDTARVGPGQTCAPASCGSETQVRVAITDLSMRPSTVVVSGIHARGHRLLESRGVIARVCTGGTAGAVGLCVGSRGYRPPGW